MFEMTKDFLETPDIEFSSEDYVQRYGGEVGEWFLSVQIQATLRMLAPYPGATILDLGGNHRQITESLVRNQFDVTVTGSSDRYKAHIKPMVDREVCNFDVVDFLNLPYNDKSFGVVISYGLLQHVKQWQRFLAEMTRVAEKCVIIGYPETHSINHFAPKLVQFKRQLEGKKSSYKTFNERELIQEFRQHHFLNSGQYSEFFLPMFLHRKLGNVRFSAALERSSRQLGLTKRFGSPRVLKFIREQQISHI